MGAQGEERVSIRPPHLLSRVPSSSSLFQNGIFPVGPVLTPGWDNIGPLPGRGSFLGRGEEQIRVQPAFQAMGLWRSPMFWREHVPHPVKCLSGQTRPVVASAGHALPWDGELS